MMFHNSDLLFGPPCILAAYTDLVR